MKLKEIDRTANISWSPAKRYPTYLSVATAGQQLDATFSTKASLELFQVDLSDSTQDMEVSKRIDLDSRLYKMVWSSAPEELLIGGAEEGGLFIWSVDKIFNNQDALVHKLEKHSGIVAALDINAFQLNLLASGGGDSEIFIWDLINPDKPMTPGSKSQPVTDVSCLSWNRQVQHILASSHAGSCIVWDLRKSDPIIKIRDSLSKIKCKQICWHPDVATQLCLASEDDHSPVLQIWDLRSAASPLRQLESHQRGILSIAWCPHDSDLLLSVGKDNRLICWNPNVDTRSGEIVYELPMSNQWCFDVQWSPRNPGIISCASFDGRVGIYSLMGGKPSAETSAKVAGAFGAESLMQPVPHASMEPPAETSLKIAPKWMKKPCGANFAFGGRLTSFSNSKNASGANIGEVLILQLVTETEFVERSSILDAALSSGQLLPYCDQKAAAATDKHEEDIWKFLKVNFGQDPKSEFLKLLGHGATADESGGQQNAASQNGYSQHQQMHEMGEGLSNLNIKEPASKSHPDTPLTFNLDPDWSGEVTRALLIGNFDAAVEACLKAGKHVEALLLASSASPKLVHKTQVRVLDDHNSSLNQLMRGIIFGDFKYLVSVSDLKNWKEMIVLILTYTSGHDLLNLLNYLGERLKNSEDLNLSQSADLCHVVSGNINELVASWSNKISLQNDPLALQSLIEKVMVLRKALNLPSRLQEQVSDGASFVTPLIQYGRLLGEQGCIVSALKYLQNFDNSSVNILKDRCYTSLGCPRDMSAPSKPFPILNLGPASRLQQISKTDKQSRVRTNSATYYQNTGLQQQDYMRQMSHGSTHSSGPHKPNYPTPPMSAYPSSNSLVGHSNMVGDMGTLGTQNGAYLSNSALASSVPLVPTFNQSQQPGLAPAGRGQGSNYYPNSQPFVQNSNITNPMPLNQPNELTHQPTSVIHSTAAYVPKSVTAWNDPPYAQPTKPTKSEPKQPVYNGILYNPQDYQPPSAPTAQPTQHLHPQPSNIANKMAPTQMPTAEKLPVAEENKIIIDTLNRLVLQCLNLTANNLSIKKKIEDITKKLDLLHNLLANHSLSEWTLKGLHGIVGSVLQGDYQTALQWHQSIVSQGSFSEVSHFLPAVKTLILTAQQHQIYLQSYAS